MARPLYSSMKKIKRNSVLIRPGLLCQSIGYGSNLLGMSYYLKNSLFLNEYKNSIQCLREKVPEIASDELKKLLNEVTSKDLKNEISENTEVELFVTPGMNTTHIGTVGTINGALVGIPLFFELKDESDVKENILIKNYGFEDVTKEKEFIDNFLLSDKAKKYAMAREVFLINTLKVYINAILPFAVSLIGVIFYNSIHETFNILQRPLFGRILIYMVIAVVGLSLLRFLYRNVLHYYESEVEAMVAALGTDYIEGGIEYCSKELKRNEISTEVKNGEVRILKEIEDFISKFILKSIPVTVRLEYLKEYSKCEGKADVDVNKINTNLQK